MLHANLFLFQSLSHSLNGAFFILSLFNLTGQVGQAGVSPILFAALGARTIALLHLSMNKNPFQVNASSYLR